MTIATYSQLQTSIEDFLERADLTARVPDFITMAEAKFNRVLFVPQMEGRSVTSIDTTSTDPEFISLPVDFQSMERLRLSSVTGKPVLEYRSGKQVDEYRTMIDNVTGQPRFFTVMGTELELCPTPVSNYVLEMFYRKTVPPLASNSTNWLLLLAPDVYMYGSLVEAAPFMGEDPRIALWQGAFDKAIAELNGLGIASEGDAKPIRAAAGAR